MAGDADRMLTEAVLAAWNSQDVERVLACYTDDCVYRDPNTKGPVIGRDALGRYLTKLFKNWKMTWALREYFPFGDDGGGAFLWKASLGPASGGPAREIEGMDLVLVRDGKVARNEVHFDRGTLFS